ncbi:MAG: hypothetical protein JO040_15510, partial [Gemmatimonadetes bacterium]|nr:hypothetical protein [Gemmatimonadota bacterium]
MKLYLRILGYLRPHAGLFVTSIVAMTIFAALDAFSFTLLIPFLNVLFGANSLALSGRGGMFGSGSSTMGRLLEWAVGDLVSAGSAMGALRNVVLVIFGVFVVKNVALYVQNYTTSMTEGRVTRDIRNQIYGHLLRLGFPFFQRTRTGQIISRVTSDVDQMRMLVTNNLSKALSNSIQTVFFLGMLLLISWKLTLVAAISLPPMLGLWGRFRKRLRTGVLSVLDAVGEVSSNIQETVSGIRVVKASGAEEWELERFHGLTRRHYRAMVRNERWRQFFGPATEMITASSVLALLWFGS